MSASLLWGFSTYTGTPKTTDTTLGLLWSLSSQAEWVIRCTHCGKLNVPNPEQDLLKMIGKKGPVCAKCGKDIFPCNGGYVHAYPERMMIFPGYHISQTVHPLHMISMDKWNDLLSKMETYPTLKLYNEVFGWPYDLSVIPLTLNDLMNSSHKYDGNKPEDFESVMEQYRYVAVGVDWSGGGIVSDSYTDMAVCGLRNDSDVIDVLFGARLLKGLEAATEADFILKWLLGTGADCFAFDNGGAGFLRLEIMKQRGLFRIPNLTTVPINYVRPRGGDIMKYNTATRESDLSYYTLDKSRSLAVCTQAIKDCRLRMPPFAADNLHAIQRDWLALREDPRTTLGNEVVVLIGKKPGVPDDFAHATNFASSAIWDHYG